MNGPDPLKGYRGRAREVLQSLGARVWADVEIETDDGTFAGIILPRSEQADDKHVVLKLVTGYNVGLAVDRLRTVKERGFREAHYKIPEKEFPQDGAKPHVTLLGTGGTIASRLDYRTGAVIPAFTPGELYGAVPELADICNLKTIKLFGVFSENMGPEQYIAVAKAIGEQIEAGADGIVIGHGTDTMHHTAAALTFMVQDSPKPIIMVGSQRSSDRPSSDAAFNLQCAANAAARGPIAEVMVCMFGPTSDKYNLLHRGTRVRKMHSSYRSTFRTLSDIPVATCSPDAVTPLRQDYRKRRDDRRVKVDAVFDDRVAIVYYYPAMKPDIISSLVDNGYKGIIIAGTGLGHVNKPLYEPLREACKKGVSVMMTVQTMWGYAQMYVYDTGRDLMELGVVPCGNMLPEVAYIKLGWVLAHTHDRAEVARMMMEPVNGEITEREPPDGYLVFQGGLPEVGTLAARVAVMDAWRKSLLEGIRFDDKEFYGALGFKSGLEIHQQLDTPKKLFCHCPVRYRNDPPDAVILRHMRPTLSEMGTYDGTALMEFKTRKQVVYHLYRDNVCTYEMDDTPPFPINQQAVDYAIEIALMLNCKLVDEIHITRKQYLDGSIPTGFQRTAIIGVDGWVPYRGRKIGIQQLAIEEDACREVSDRGHEVVFRTDRLSTPLVEIVTLPEMYTPNEIAEVDELLGRLLRASGRVRRGIGAARQDVNVSVTGSDRVEIKGVPRTPDIRALTHYEALRHRALLDLKSELASRGIRPDTFRATSKNVTQLLSGSKHDRIRALREAGHTLEAIVLHGWGPLVRFKTQPGMTFAHELGGRVRVIACVDEMPNLMVLDGVGDGLKVEDETRVRRFVGANPDDAVVLAWGHGEDARTAVEELIARAREATLGVPQETRQHLPDGCRTDFERILPGADRMYPDTDSPPVPISRERAAAIGALRALRPWEREESYRGKGIPVALARRLAIHPHARVVDRILATTSLSPVLVAVAVAEWQTAIRRKRASGRTLVPLAPAASVEQLLTMAAQRSTPRRALFQALERLYAEGVVEAPAGLEPAAAAALCDRLLAEHTAPRRKTPQLTIDFLVGKGLELSAGCLDPRTVRESVSPRVIG